MSFFDQMDENEAYAHYFAYDATMDSQAFSRLGIHFVDACPAILLGYRLVFNVLEDVHFRFEKRGLANILPSAGDTVEGMIYRIQNEDLPRLDQSAGVPMLKYYRKQVTARNIRGKNITAYVYAAWPDVTAQGLLPSDTYLRQILNAASQVQVSEHFQQWLRDHPTTL